MNNAYPDRVTDTTTVAQYRLGERRIERDETNGGMKVYRYFEYSASAVAAAANGTVVTLEDVYATTVTDDITAGLGANHVAGVAVGAIAKGSYGWIQTGGYHEAVKTDAGDDISKGDSLIAAGDGVVDSVAAGTAPTYKPVGYAAADDINAADTVAARIALDPQV